MTASTTTTGTRTADGKIGAVVPVPRQSPEDRHEPEESQPYYAYPGVYYALEHATALRPRGH